jgi:hypothetical protein
MKTEAENQTTSSSEVVPRRNKPDIFDSAIESVEEYRQTYERVTEDRRLCGILREAHRESAISCIEKGFIESARLELGCMLSEMSVMGMHTEVLNAIEVKMLETCVLTMTPMEYKHHSGADIEACLENLAGEQGLTLARSQTGEGE